MKTIALVLLLAMNGPAAAGYDAAVAMLKNLGDQQVKELDALLAQTGAVLVKDARASALLAENQAALGLFREAAGEPNDGYLFAPKPEKLNAKTILPVYTQHIKLFKLLLLDAKAKAAQKQANPANQNLLSAAGFIEQLADQKAGVLVSSMVEFMCLQKAYPLIADSLKSPAASPAYLKELAARLERIGQKQDFLRAAMLEEAETAKGAVLDAVNPATAAEDLKKIPFWKRFIVKKQQDKEFYSMVYQQFNAVEDEHAQAMIAAARANDAAPVLAFEKKLEEGLQARKQARGKRGAVSEFIAGLKGGPGAKKLLAEEAADTMLAIATPSYGKLLPRYHMFLCELGVLRSAAAAKLYKRARKRLPDSLGQLVPAQLSAVPQDSFNKSAPLTYAKSGKKFLIYSFGPDGKDDKGGAALDFAAYAENPAHNAGDIVYAE